MHPAYNKDDVATRSSVLRGRESSGTLKERRYWIALFNKGGESAGVERELGRHARLDSARTIYRQMVATYPARLVMLCDRARVLARSDRSGSQYFRSHACCRSAQAR
jgi:hypothetical protein